LSLNLWVDIDSSVNLSLQADKRAHHNALERKRRDHIKDSFSSLRDSVPVLQGEKQSVKQASRAQILDKATDYIQYMRRKNHTHQQDIDDLKKQNAMLEQQGSLYFAPFIFPSIVTSLPVPADEKHPYSMMLPPPCFTVGMVPGLLQM
uniref:Protein max n=1 Tax=Oncorhynchus mykiss TaxID=8022 RepID=A0A8C7SPC0_ONCMY